MEFWTRGLMETLSDMINLLSSRYDLIQANDKLDKVRYSDNPKHYMYDDDALLIKNLHGPVPSDANDTATPHSNAFLSWRRGLDPVFPSMFLAPIFHHERTLCRLSYVPGAFRNVQPLEATQSRG